MRTQRRRARRRGQALLETGLVVMFLAVLLLGVIGFGTIITASSTLETAARNGARAASAGHSNTAIQTAVMTALSPQGDASAVQGTVAIAVTPSTEGLRTFKTQVTVEVWWQYPVRVPLFNLIVNDRLLYARKTMLVTAGV